VPLGALLMAIFCLDIAWIAADRRAGARSR